MTTAKEARLAGKDHHLNRCPAAARNAAKQRNRGTFDNTVNQARAAHHARVLSERRELSNTFPGAEEVTDGRN